MSFQTIPGFMSSWLLTWSKPGLDVWRWCECEWWWSNGAFIWCGVKIIVLCWCCTCKPTSIAFGSWLLLCVLLLLLLLLLLLFCELWCMSFAFCGSSESLHDSDDPFFTLPGFDPLCVFTCFARWSDRMKRLLHTGHCDRCGEIFDIILMYSSTVETVFFFRVFNLSYLQQISSLPCEYVNVFEVHRTVWIVYHRIANCRQRDVHLLFIHRHTWYFEKWEKSFSDLAISTAI